MKQSYKDLKQELDEIMEWFDKEDLDIDEAIVKYESAIKITKEIEKYLLTAENKVKKIKKD